MAAVVRIKRRLEDAPADSLIVLCKRQKVLLSSEDAKKNEGKDSEAKIESVFKYAGTVAEDEKSVSKCIRDAISKEKLEREYKRHNFGDYRDVKTQGKRKKAMEARYNVVSTRRAMNLETLNEPLKSSNSAVKVQQGGEAKNESAAAEGKFVCFDVEKTEKESRAAPCPGSDEMILCNGVPMIREKVTSADETRYVYDLYYMNTAQFDFRAFEDILAVEAYKEEFIYDGDNSDSDALSDDDENAENNWRNDYPDEDPRFYDPPSFKSSENFHYYDYDSRAAFSEDEDDLENDFTSQLSLSHKSRDDKTPQDLIAHFTRLRDS